MMGLNREEAQLLRTAPPVGVYMQAMITRLVGWKRKLISVAISY